ncbi:MAG: hypothetical protein ISP88_10710 [Pseudomonadales bacterium]|nr:hypothetical protein [Pseudomonadales bacterium]MBL6817469.1 hypothetical protein [Pseudomonadales bacterium]
MKSSQISAPRIVSVLCVLLMPAVLSAHHSTNANFTQEIISVEGVIERVRFVNPHASVLINNTDTEGNETFWLVESGARTTLERQGVTLEHLEIGSKITATGRKGRRENTMYLQKIIYEDGSEFIPQPELN